MPSQVTPDGSPIDLRDPHLCVTPHGRLMLHSAVAYHGRRDMQSLAWFSQDGTTWSKPVLIAEHPAGNGKTWGRRSAAQT
jgi:hypothetical protein